MTLNKRNILCSLILTLYFVVDWHSGKTLCHRFLSCNIGGSRPRVSRERQLYEGRHRRGSGSGCSYPHLHHKTVSENVGKECQVKNASQNSVALAVKKHRKVKMKVSRITLQWAWLKV